MGADELVVVEEENARDAAPETRIKAGQEADCPNVIAQRRHTPRLIAGSAQTGAERRLNEGGHRKDGEEKNDQSCLVECIRGCKRNSERRWPRRRGKAVVAIG